MRTQTDSGKKETIYELMSLFFSLKYGYVLRGSVEHRPADMEK